MVRRNDPGGGGQGSKDFGGDFSQALKGTRTEQAGCKKITIPKKTVSPRGGGQRRGSRTDEKTSTARGRREQDQSAEESITSCDQKKRNVLKGIISDSRIGESRVGREGKTCSGERGNVKKSVRIPPVKKRKIFTL